MELVVRNASCGYGAKNVISNISVSVKSGEILCILGPNGVGKTTLFKTILGFLKLQSGEILLDNENIRTWSQKRLAKAVSYVPQAHSPPFPFSVFDVVLMGRTAHLNMFASPSHKDKEIAEQAIDTLKISYLRNSIYTEISGGERQMVLIARSLAQQANIMVMDEPTSNLDFGNQVRVLRQINNLASKGFGVIMTSHFPDQAFLCSTKAALMQKDCSLIVGTVDEVITEDNLRSAYGVNVKIISIDVDGEIVKSVVPLLN